jgi:hypothetical protein
MYEAGITVPGIFGGFSPFYMEGANGFYIPDWGLNFLEVYKKYGYKFFHNSPASFSVSGRELSGGDSVRINANTVTYIGYPYTSEHTAQEIFGAYPSIIYADDGRGNVYIPGWGVTNMPMYPGRGYQVFATADIHPFHFPVLENTTAKQLTNFPQTSEYQGELTFCNDGKAYPIVLESIVDNMDLLSSGIEIAAYDGEKCVGALTTYGTNKTEILISWMRVQRLNIDGARESVPITIKVFTSEGELDQSLYSVSFTAGGNYGDDLFSVAKIKLVNNVPETFLLDQNFPNPFNPSTIIRFGLPQDEKIAIEVFNILGEKVRTISEGFYKAGYHEVVFDAAKLPSGVYFYRISSETFKDVKKMLLLK